MHQGEAAILYPRALGLQVPSEKALGVGLEGPNTLDVLGALGILIAPAPNKAAAQKPRWALNDLDQFGKSRQRHISVDQQTSLAQSWR